MDAAMDAAMDASMDEVIVHMGGCALPTSTAITTTIIAIATTNHNHEPERTNADTQTGHYFCRIARTV